ncbi:E3 ubiquitin-protein ligase DCST1-like [Glandiceps talaboti]
MTLTVLLTGPVFNIFNNAQELSRSVTCTAALTYNNSKLLFQLMHKPFGDVLEDLKLQISNIEEISAQLKQQFVKIEEEVEKDEEEEDNKKQKKGGLKVEDKYREKLDFRCKDIFSQGVEHCEEKFREAERKCHDSIKLPLVKDVLCAPMKLTILCKIVSGFDSLCDSGTDESVNPGFGETYKEADEAVKEFDKNFEVKMGWEVIEQPEQLNMRTSDDIKLAVTNEFESRKRWFVVIATLIKSVVAFNFVLIFLSAHGYHKKYIGGINYDNVYMTSYFIKIENRRKQQKKRILLPLKKAEKSELVFPTRLALLPEERGKLIRGTMTICLHVMVATIITLFDYLLYHVMDIVHRHSQVTITLQGTHVIRLAIHGEGAVAHLFQTMLSGFNNEHSIDSVTTNTDCLPQPTATSSTTLYMIFGGWGIVWILFYVQAFGLRLRRVICSYFYPKREKKRILYLYNDCLRKRVGFLKHMQKHVQRLAREEKLMADISILTSLRYTYPTLCCCLALFGLGKKRCLICGDKEDKNTHHCEGENCKMAYCQQCWQDIEEECYACSPFSYQDSSSDSDMADSEIEMD